MKWSLLITIPFASNVKCWFNMLTIHSKWPTIENELSWWSIIFHLMSNVHLKWKKFIQSHQIFQKNFLDYYSSCISCWTSISNGSKLFQITKYLKRILLIIIRLSSDVECGFELLSIASKSPNTWKECCWWLFIFYLMLNVDLKSKQFINNQQKLEKNVADNYSSFIWCSMLI